MELCLLSPNLAGAWQMELWSGCGSKTTQLSKFEVGDLSESRRCKRLLAKIELLPNRQKSTVHTDTVPVGEHERSDYWLIRAGYLHQEPLIDQKMYKF